MDYTRSVALNKLIRNYSFESAAVMSMRWSLCLAIYDAIVPCSAYSVCASSMRLCFSQGLHYAYACFGGTHGQWLPSDKTGSILALVRMLSAGILHLHTAKAFLRLK